MSQAPTDLRGQEKSITTLDEMAEMPEEFQEEAGDETYALSAGNEEEARNIIVGQEETPDELSKKARSALHKASLKMQNIMVSKHGKVRADQIVRERIEEQTRYRPSYTLIYRAVVGELHDPASVFWNPAMLKMLSMCPLRSS